MTIRGVCFLTFALSTGLVAAEESYKLAEIKEPPQGLAKGIQSVLNPQGYQVTGPDGPLISVWLTRNVVTKANFEPTLSVKYPFEPAQLIGALQVHENSGYTDFRGQEIPAGAYTLRYGQQPMDGNHIGTSETQDFLLAIPAEDDKDPFPLRFVKDLHEKSAKSAGATHPAILPLVPVEGEAGKTASLTHDEDRDFWILNLSGTSRKGGQETKVPLRIIVVGLSEV